MHVPKVCHPFFSGLLSVPASIAVFLLLHGRIGLWALLVALLCLPIVWVVGTIILDVLDDWLRRVTNDPR